MKKLIVLPLALVLLAGCSSTPYVDKEYGKATGMALDSQISDQTYRHADRTPEGISGLAAEKIMTVYTNEFGEETVAEAAPTTFQSGGGTSSSTTSSK